MAGAFVGSVQCWFSPLDGQSTGRSHMVSVDLSDLSAAPVVC